MEKEIPVYVADTQAEAVQLLEKELEIAPFEPVEEAATESEAIEAGKKLVEAIQAESRDPLVPFGSNDPLEYKFENFEFVVDSIQEDGQVLAHRKDSPIKCLLTLENDKIKKISYLEV